MPTNPARLRSIRALTLLLVALLAANSAASSNDVQPAPPVATVKSETYLHTCKYVTARDAEKCLITQLGNQLQLQMPRPYSIGVDDRTNQIIVTGPPDAVAQARDILKRIDVREDGGQRQPMPGFSFKRYDIPGGNAETLAAALKEQFKGSPVKIEAVGKDQILVYATAPDHAKVIQAMRFQFSMDSEKWENVFAWLTRETGIPVLANSYPSGRFSFQGPAGNRYSLDEIVDIINGGLLCPREETKYFLFANEKAFILIGTDEKLEPELVRNVTVGDLPTLGKTALVRCRWKIETHSVLDLANEMKPLLSPLGRIDVLRRTNTILITDFAANLRRLDNYIADRCAQPPVPKEGCSTKVIDISGGNADTVAKVVASTFDVCVEVLGPKQIQVYATASDHAKIAGLLGGCGCGCGGTRQQIKVRRVACGTLAADHVASLLNALLVDNVPSPPFLDVEEDDNAIILRGTEEQVAVACEAINIITGEKAATEDNFVTEVIHLNATTSAVMVAGVIDEVFNGPAQQKTRRERIRVVVNVQTNSLRVQATPLDLLTIKRLLQPKIVP
jgi:hypothetical protein